MSTTSDTLIVEDRSEFFIRALAEGVAHCMREDPTVMVVGEDVRRGIIGATRGLFDEFGDQRVINTPISESAVLGACVGGAATGLRPVMDLMIGSFLYVAMDQLANQAARLSYMSGGQVRVPLTLIATSGPSGSAAAQHSESMHGLAMGISGLKVVVPSNPQDARGLMISAIRDDGPVLVLEDPLITGQRGLVTREIEAIPLGKARVVREGSDVTVVAVGSLVGMATKAAAEVAKDGISCEIIDPRCLHPLDLESICASVEKTGRLLVCDPARPAGGAAAEILASVLPEVHKSLKSYPRRLTFRNTPMPYSPPLEAFVTLSPADIAVAIRETVADLRSSRD